MGTEETRLKDWGGDGVGMGWGCTERDWGGVIIDRQSVGTAPTDSCMGSQVK